ncbi:HAMP domain-containing sensor histidine kinase [Parabacteroides sp. PF5-6]|uniref:sensor histidine kinase n=1 Tax=Parabacteroides sp. PF5-6 TaxID=1742403 RepID=UPI002405580B|nr:HAMP domain-containing sensor histidine kinase [Parabacteroides sp. PF5-6]MDF9830776.1 signal transduction histidine kinase [Parabacteroides sp. PF5-6]
MKLNQYTLRNLLLPLLLIMAVWALGFYSLVLHEVNDETEDTLLNYKEIIIKHALADTTLLKDDVGLMNSYFIREIPAEQADLSKDVFFDATKYIEIERENEPIRVLRTHFLASNGKFYELTIEISTLEEEDLKETILWSILGLYLLLLAAILLVTHYVFRKSFRPLYSILDWLRSYHPTKPEPLLNATTIDEFNTLNEAFSQAAQRGAAIYNQQKQFVELASHELQTPLAVSMNKLELLSEDPDCTEAQLTEITDIRRTLRGLIKMNKSLLLLSRIENNQFPETQEVSLARIAEEVVADFAEVFAAREIRVYTMKESPLIRQMNESLAVTMITNLVKNAFVHNLNGGEIYLETTDRQLILSNTSENTELNRERLFQRFGKQSNRPDSTGLGLAVVKSIADLYGIEVSYNYNGKHQFALTFEL